MHPHFALIDVLILGLYLAFTVATGFWFRSRAGTSVDSFFVGDRQLPWWLAGTSIVATTFAADTPLAVTGLVAADGIAGNWIWWSWAIAHLTATFFFARLWRRSGVITDAEITELRYSGAPAAWLRGFKALYFGLFINCLTMAWVIAAMIKISRAFFNVQPAVVVALCILVSVSYTLLGGFRSVVTTDLVQFALGMGGALILAYLVISSFGGLGTTGQAGGEEPAGLLGAVAQAVADNGERSLNDVLSFLPPMDHPTLPAIYFLVLLTVGWWHYAEGNGYIVQRLAACRDEGQAQGAALWFAVAHNALRPWPWIVVGLAALVLYPQLPGQAPPALEARLGAATLTITPATLDTSQGGTLAVRGLAGSCQATVAGQTVAGQAGAGAGTDTLFSFGRFAASGVFPVAFSCQGDGQPFTATAEGLRLELLDREMAYPLILGSTLPAGLLGLVVASLLAAFMSTIDTHTNWGASYLVRDVYQRFLRPEASTAEAVLASRWAIVLMALLAGVASLFIQNIAAVWRFLITLGAGLGSVAAVRWYWSRVTVWAEFAALGVTTVMALGLEILTNQELLGAANPFFVAPMAPWSKILLVAGASLAAWLPVALLGPATDEETLRRFAQKVRPPGPGWRRQRLGPGEKLGPSSLRFLAGLGIVFGSLFGSGEVLLGSAATGWAMLAGAALLLVWVIRSGKSQQREAT